MKSLKQQMQENRERKKAKAGPFTPKAPFSREVQIVLDRLPSKDKPQSLLYTDVLAGYSGAACHLNVKHRVQTAGGRRVHGWVVWQYPNGVAQAEFHSVWENDEGELLDITPHRNSQANVLFVRDNTLAITQDPETGRDVLYSAITSRAAPTYAVGDLLTDSPQYTLQVPEGSELANAMSQFKVTDLR